MINCKVIVNESSYITVDHVVDLILAACSDHTLTMISRYTCENRPSCLLIGLLYPYKFQQYHAET